MTKSAVILRHKDDGVEALGNLIVIDGFSIPLNLPTLERPWKNNQPNVSCIPVGKYHCTPITTDHLGKHYRVECVPNRLLIAIHSANFFLQLEGCIALGSALEDINGDGEPDTTGSRAALDKFIEIMDFQPFELEIINL